FDPQRRVRDDGEKREKREKPYVNESPEIHSDNLNGEHFISGMGARLSNATHKASSRRGEWRNDVARSERNRLPEGAIFQVGEQTAKTTIN
ncbi:hypothetical protein WA026_019041, partial [Henosepilachna vigintioctopunctata]